MEDNELKELVNKLSKRVEELEKRLDDLENIVNTDSALVEELAYKARII